MLGRIAGLAGQSHPKPSQSHLKATTKPYTRHILGIDSGVQRHLKATPKPHPCAIRATPKPPQGSTKAPPRPPQGYPRATGDGRWEMAATPGKATRRQLQATWTHSRSRAALYIASITVTRAAASRGGTRGWSLAPTTASTN